MVSQFFFCSWFLSLFLTFVTFFSSFSSHFGLIIQKLYHKLDYTHLYNGIMVSFVCGIRLLQSSKSLMRTDLWILIFSFFYSLFRQHLIDKIKSITTIKQISSTIINWKICSINTHIHYFYWIEEARKVFELLVIVCRKKTKIISSRRSKRNGKKEMSWNNTRKLIISNEKKDQKVVVTHRSQMSCIFKL